MASWSLTVRYRIERWIGPAAAGCEDHRRCFLGILTRTHLRNCSCRGMNAVLNERADFRWGNVFRQLIHGSNRSLGLGRKSHVCAENSGRAERLTPRKREADGETFETGAGSRGRRKIRGLAGYRISLQWPASIRSHPILTYLRGRTYGQHYDSCARRNPHRRQHQ